MIDNFSDVINIIKNKIFLIFSRGVLSGVTDAGKIQTVQITGLKSETISDIDRYQEYGFESKPKTGAEVFVVFQGGDREQGAALCVMDRRYRPSGMQDGEVKIYDFNGSIIYIKSDKSILIDSEAGSKIDLKSDGTFRVDDKNGNYIKSTTSQVDINGNLTIDM